MGGWDVVDEARCGHNCGADLHIGRDKRHYDLGVSFAMVDSCLERCRAEPACRGVHFVGEGKEGSGGPGEVDVYSGACYYKMKTCCGVECKEDMKCFTLQEPRHEGL